MNMNQNTKQVTFEEIKQDPDIRTYIKKADESLIALGFTEHSFAHVTNVAANAKYILETLGCFLGIGSLTGQEVIFIVFSCFYITHN